MNSRIKNFVVAMAILLLAACGTSDDHTHVDGGHAHNESSASAEPAKGPHRGRLLSEGDVTVEVAIFETGVPPEFHVYVTQAGKPVAPAAVKLAIELTRLGGKIDRISFVPEKDYLKGTDSIVEPHSFDAKVMLELAGKSYAWSYASYEGRTTIAADMANASGIKTAVAGPGILRDSLTLHGTIAPNAERVRSVVARFPGPIRSVLNPIGAEVKAGDTLATVESNDSLQTYAVTAPIAGVITERHANAGEVAGNEPLFVIADYSSVWAELTFFARDRSRIQIGQRVKITAADGEQSDEGVIAHIAPSASNQTFIARVALTNADARWTPGLFVSGAITVGEREVPLLVANSALQGFRDFTVVFAQINETYEVRMLELGRSDGDMTEVLGGLDPGTVYVTENSYLIKADIEKSGASHDH